MPRILCLDYGEKRTGVAVSDETRTIAQSLTTITHRNDEDLMVKIRHLIQKYNIDLIVIGLPLSLTGKPSTRSEKIRRLASRLARHLHLPVELFDERLTTRYAEQIYAEVHGRQYRNQSGPDSPIDRIAATLILENYLNWVQSCRRRPDVENL
ncbi:MAG: Holliday junction resolvase RuvX [candidate division WOR-3 bacterium]